MYLSVDEQQNTCYHVKNHNWLLIFRLRYLYDYLIINKLYIVLLLRSIERQLNRSIVHQKTRLCLETIEDVIDR